MLTSEEGWANLVQLGETLIFLELPYPMWVLAVGFRGTLLPTSIQERDFPTQSPSFVAVEVGGSIQRSDVLFLTLEMNTLGFRALTCLIFMVKITPFLISSCCACCFLVGVYINVLNSSLHSKEVSRNHKYMYTYTYIKYILK